MPLTTIYITRHGHRSNWLVDHRTGEYSSSYPTPTNNPADPALSSHGVKQSHELAKHLIQLSPNPFDSEAGGVYCSPYYRCLQTLAPTAAILREAGWKGKIRGETGVAEWYGSAPFTHPSPAANTLLRSFFPFLAPSEHYSPQITPSPKGESIAELHDRLAHALSSIIHTADAEIATYESSSPDPPQPRAILICSHAAPIIAMGRVLTGRMPDDIAEEDFLPFTCGVSTFKRLHVPPVETETEAESDSWRSWRSNGGVGGGWICMKNGDCSFLSAGEERGWHFTGEEDFTTDARPVVDSGAGVWADGGGVGSKL